MHIVYLALASNFKVYLLACLPIIVFQHLASTRFVSVRLASNGALRHVTSSSKTYITFVSEERNFIANC